MLIKQMSVFVENTTGRLAELTRILAEHDIDIKASTIADTVDFGILRCIVLIRKRPPGSLRKQALQPASRK